MADETDEVVTYRGYGVTMRGIPDKHSLALPIAAIVSFPVSQNAVGFVFQDTVATVVADCDDAFPNGYGANRDDPDDRHMPSYSDCTGMIGGGYRVRIFLEQFGIPCEPGQYVKFCAGPDKIVQACVDAIKQELLAPEYYI